MSEIERVTQQLSAVKYMTQDQALTLRDHMIEHGLSDVLEVGFFQGKSTAYFAAIVKEMGRGHVTALDKTNAKDRSPNIHENLELLGYSHLVTPIFAERSHTWELGRMIRQNPRPQFDLCYFDGGHTWDVTGFGFLLVDLLLKPGGWIVFDDLDWTIEKSSRANATNFKSYKHFGKDEREAPGVRMVFENLVPSRGYKNMHENRGWGFAQKPSW